MARRLIGANLAALREHQQARRARMLLILRAEEESEQKRYSLSSRLEFWKTMVDYYKHLMILSMASIAAFGGY
jgi:hypothetical protein